MAAAVKMGDLSAVRQLLPFFVRSIHFKRLGLMLASAVLAIVTFSIWERRLGFHQLDRTGDIISVADTFQKPKRIVYWTTYYNQTDFTFGMGTEPFVQAGCKVTNCFATADRSRLNESDALIFHAGNYDAGDLPGHRRPDQRYIFLLFETLPGSAHLPFFSKTDNYFNWTMTHRRDSDIYVGKPYGALRRSKPADYDLPARLRAGERSHHPEQLIRDRLSPSVSPNRTKMVAWFNSHCPTDSKREDYVNELAKHVQVDIYGSCGNMECLPRNDPRCDVLLDRYKFYLAAENSLCPDYVTEKFYRALMNNVVPIVIGGADYTQYAPPHSYVNVADFATPKQLADYLHFLDHHPSVYAKYFEWKAEWEVVRKPLNGWCHLCEKLNDPLEPAKTYPSMARWWFDDVPCMPGSSFLQTKLSITA